MEEKDPRLSVRLSPEEIKAVKMFVLEHDTTVQAFIQNAIKYCMEKKIIPK